MKISEVIEKLRLMGAHHGDAHVVLYDLDSGYYFQLYPGCFELQKMADGSMRISVGPNDYGDPCAGEPAERFPEPDELSIERR